MSRAILNLLDELQRQQDARTARLQTLTTIALQEADFNAVRIQHHGKTGYLVTEEMLVHFLRCAFFAAENASALEESGAPSKPSMRP